MHLGFARCYLGMFEEAEEAKLLRPEDQERMASALDASGRPAHPVDVLLQIGIDLNDNTQNEREAMSD